MSDENPTKTKERFTPEEIELLSKLKAPIEELARFTRFSADECYVLWRYGVDPEAANRLKEDMLRLVTLQASNEYDFCVEGLILKAAQLKHKEAYDAFEREVSDRVTDKGSLGLERFIDKHYDADKLQSGICEHSVEFVPLEYIHAFDGKDVPAKVILALYQLKFRPQDYDRLTEDNVSQILYLYEMGQGALTVQGFGRESTIFDYSRWRNIGEIQKLPRDANKETSFMKMLAFRHRNKQRNVVQIDEQLYIRHTKGKDVHYFEDIDFGQSSYDPIHPYGEKNDGKVKLRRLQSCVINVLLDHALDELALKPEDIRQMVEREIRLTSNLQDSEEIRYIPESVRQAAYDNFMRAFISLKRIEGSSLDSILQNQGKLPHDKVLRYGAQICNGLYELRQAGIYHTDLHPGNIVIESKEDNAIVLDLGTATRDKDEVNPGNRACGGNNDLISLGQIMYKMATGHNLFNDGYGLTYENPVKDRIKSDREEVYADPAKLEACFDKIRHDVKDEDLACLIVDMLHDKLWVQPPMDRIEEMKNRMQVYIDGR